MADGLLGAAQDFPDAGWMGSGDGALAELILLVRGPGWTGDQWAFHFVVAVVITTRPESAGRGSAHHNGERRLWPWRVQ